MLHLSRVGLTWRPPRLELTREAAVTIAAVACVVLAEIAWIVLLFLMARWVL